MSDHSSEDSVYLTAELSSTTTSNYITMTSNSVHEQNCPIQVTCKYCPNDTKCNEEKSSLDENILGLQNVTRFGAVIEYSCPLGMEFEAQKPPATTTTIPLSKGNPFFPCHVLES